MPSGHLHVFPSPGSHAGEEEEEQAEGFTDQRVGKQSRVPLEIEQYLIHDPDVQVHGKEIGITEIINIHHQEDDADSPHKVEVLIESSCFVL